MLHQWDIMGMMLVYTIPILAFAPKQTTFSLPVLMDCDSGALLMSLRLLLLGDSDIHVAMLVAGLALEFMNSIMSMGLSQHVTGLAHVAGQTLDLVFMSGWRNDYLKVVNFASSALSWSDHHLLRFGLCTLVPSMGRADLLKWSAPKDCWI